MAESRSGVDPAWIPPRVVTARLASLPGLFRMRPATAVLAAGGDRRLVRLVARLLELTDTVQWLASGDGETGPQRWFGCAATADHAGYGWVETARGLLVHHVVLGREYIAAYRVLAPTEWNFHPDGSLVRELSTIEARDETELQTQAELPVVALDPFVAFEVHVNHA